MAYHMAYRHTLLTKVHSIFEFQVVQSNPSTVQLLTSFTSFTKKAIKNHKFLILKVRNPLPLKFRISNMENNNKLLKITHFDYFEAINYLKKLLEEIYNLGTISTQEE